MNVHEYQAKQLFRQYGLPVPEGLVCTSIRDAETATTQLGTAPWVIKCQVHAGGRGKAGGVKLIHNAVEAKAFAEQWLGQYLVTHQTDAKGQPVHQVLIEEATAIAKELYLGIVIDRESQRIVVMASQEGGMDIEQVAAETPERIHTVALHPLLGAQPWQGRALAFKLGLAGKQIRQFADIFIKLTGLFVSCDLSMVEINPLVITQAGDLKCLDAKLDIDSNALFRHPELAALTDTSQEDKREARAAEWQLNYVALDGNIGCMVNGAGLAMGTMDIIKLHGGAPANFLDVGGGATKERVTEAFKLILSDHNVKTVLVNIFGGIVRCDLIAEGIIGAITEVGVNIPVIVRLEGNNAERGAQCLAESGLDIIAANDLTDAAQQAVAAAEGK